MAGTKYRGEFEERLKKLMEEVKQDDKIILFIDEACTLQICAMSYAPSCARNAEENAATLKHLL